MVDGGLSFPRLEHAVRTEVEDLLDDLTGESGSILAIEQYLSCADDLIALIDLASQVVA